MFQLKRAQCLYMKFLLSYSYVVPSVTIQGNDNTDENNNITDYLSKFNTKKYGDRTKGTDEPAQN